MKKKSVFWALVLIIITVELLCSCGTYEDNEEEESTEETTEETERLLTAEELYELTDLTAEDFVNVDVDEFISIFRLTRKSERDANHARRCYELYTKEPEVSYLDDYKYLFESSLKKLETGMADQIKTVYVNYIFGAGFAYYGGSSILYDFKKNRVFHNSFLEYDSDITEKEKEGLKKLIEESGIEKLNAEKTGLGATHEGYEIIIESEDGRIAHYKGENTMPKEAEEFCEGIFAVRRER